MGTFYFTKFTEKLKGSHRASKFVNLKRLGLFALLFVFISSFLTSTGIGGLIPQVAHAAGSASSCQFSPTNGWKWSGSNTICVVSTYTPEQEVSSLSYYAGLTDCIGIRMWSSIKLTVTDNKIAPPSKWFDTSTILPTPGDNYKTVNVYPDGDQSCENVVNKAMALWGWGTDYVQFLTDIGYTYNTGNATWTQGGNDTSKRNPNYQAAVKAKVYNNFTNTLPPLTNAAQYIEALHFFVGQTSASGNISCNAQDLGTYPDMGGVTGYKSLVDSRKVVSVNDAAFGNAAIKKAMGNSDVYIRYDKAMIVDPTLRTGIPHGYVFIKGSTYQDSYPVNVYDYQAYGTANTETCDQLLKDINSYAGAYVTWLGNNTTKPATGPLTVGCKTGDPNCTTKDTPPSCGSRVSGIGWIVCPIITALTGLNDLMWGFTSTLLTINPLSQTSSGGSIYAAWGALRNIGNVAFVIVFLVVIFSQLTSVGISNYGVKKMVPRLIIAAILVNSSFFVVQVAVDLSNVLGSSLYDLIVGLTPNDPPTWDHLLATISDVAVGTVITIAAVTIAGGWGAVFFLILPIAIMGALGLLAAVLTLIFRQAIVPILAILAPIAFVAYLLPNTESLFKKWRGLLISMLVLYPVAALLFAGVRFASSVLAQGSWFDQMIGLIILTIPLFSLPFLARQGGPMLSKVSSSLSGLAKRAGSPIKGLTDSFAKTAKSKYMANTPGRFNIGQKVRQRFDRNARTRKLTQEANESTVDAAWAGRTISDDKLKALTQTKLTNNAAMGAANGSHQQDFSRSLIDNGGANITDALGEGGQNEEVAKSIAAAVFKATSDAVKEAELSVKVAPGDQAGMAEIFKNAVRGNDLITAQAMQNKLLTSGGAGIDMFGSAMSELENTGTVSQEVKNGLRNNVLQTHAGLKSSAADLTAWASDSSGRSFDAVSGDQTTWKMSDGQFARQHSASQARAIGAGAVGREQAQRILGDKILESELNPDIRIAMKKIIAKP